MQIDRIFASDILPSLENLSVFDITRQELTEVLRRIERRGALSVAEKCRTWLNQLFRYAMVEIGVEGNPAADLDIVAMPQKPVKNNPWLPVQKLPALRRMGYADLLTGHGIRGTISTALNKMNYNEKWVDAQLSHKDKDKVRATYNHAIYIEQRRTMMQDWADLLDKWAKEGYQPLLPELQSPATEAMAKSVAVEPETPQEAPVEIPLMLVGKSRDQINRDIKAGRLLTINIGNRGQRIPDWQLDIYKRQFTTEVLQQCTEADPWQIYETLLTPQISAEDTLVSMVTRKNWQQMVKVAFAALSTG